MPGLHVLLKLGDGADEDALVARVSVVPEVVLVSVVRSALSGGVAREVA